MNASGVVRGAKWSFALLACATVGLAHTRAHANANTDAAPWEMKGVKTITVSAGDGQRIQIGTVNFEPGADGLTHFKIKLDHDKFTDYFLSMREFKCLGGSGEIACHVPYPYAQPGTVSETEYAWLEHSLMFMYKLPSEFGAKLWNGLYFQFTKTDNGLVGKLQAVDLNQIGAPPAKLNVPPFRRALRDEVPQGSRWIKAISIE
jgi:hypothetical protein